MYVATFDDKYKHAYISIPYVHRSAVPQFPASPIFSLQIDPLPDAATLKSSPIMMMFDVVGHCIIYKMPEIAVFCPLQKLHSPSPAGDLSEQNTIQNQQNFDLDDVSCNFYDYSLITDNL